MKLWQLLYRVVLVRIDPEVAHYWSLNLLATVMGGEGGKGPPDKPRLRWCNGDGLILTPYRHCPMCGGPVRSRKVSP